MDLHDSSLLAIIARLHPNEPHLRLVSPDLKEVVDDARTNLSLYISNYPPPTRTFWPRVLGANMVEIDLHLQYGPVYAPKADDMPIEDYDLVQTDTEESDTEELCLYEFESRLPMLQLHPNPRPVLPVQELLEPVMLLPNLKRLSLSDEGYYSVIEAIPALFKSATLPLQEFKLRAGAGPMHSVRMVDILTALVPLRTLQKLELRLFLIKEYREYAGVELGADLAEDHHKSMLGAAIQHEVAQRTGDISLHVTYGAHVAHEESWHEDYEHRFLANSKGIVYVDYVNAQGQHVKDFLVGRQKRGLRVQALKVRRFKESQVGIAVEQAPVCKVWLEDRVGWEDWVSEKFLDVTMLVSHSANNMHRRPLFLNALLRVGCQLNLRALCIHNRDWQEDWFQGGLEAISNTCPLLEELLMAGFEHYNITKFRSRKGLSFKASQLRAALQKLPYMRCLKIAALTMDESLEALEDSLKSIPFLAVYVHYIDKKLQKEAEESKGHQLPKALEHLGMVVARGRMWTSESSLRKKFSLSVIQSYLLSPLDNEPRFDTLLSQEDPDFRVFYEVER